MSKTRKVQKVEVAHQTSTRVQRKKAARESKARRDRAWLYEHMPRELHGWAERNWAKGWEGQLEVVRRMQRGLRRNGRVASAATISARATIWHKIFETLWSLGYKLNDIRGFGTKHLRALLAYWLQEGASPGSIANRLSALRALMEDIGKPGLIPRVDELGRLGFASDMASRHVYATRDKSWEHLPKEEKLAEIEAYDLRYGLIFRLAEMFAMRKAETVMWCPHEHAWEKEIEIAKGGKNGKKRMTPAEEADARALIERCKAVVAPGDSMSGKATYTLRQAKRRFAYIAEKFGLTKAQLGVTPHGARHGRIHRWLEDALGVPVPVRDADALWPRGPEATAKRKSIAEAVGHSRTSILTAYAGAARKEDRKRGHGSGPGMRQEGKKD
jgi:integrase